MYDVFADLCQRRGVRASDVAKATGIGASTFTDWKKGRITSPSADKLRRIAEYFGVSVDYLNSGDAETPLGYYTDPETAKAAQRIFKDPHMRILFDAAEDARPEDLDMAAALLRRMKETNPDG